MADPTCVCGCDRPTPDGYAHPACAARAARQLAEIAELAPEARAVAQRQVSRGAGGASGKPGSSLPIDLGATARYDGAVNNIVTWVRHVEEIRGVAHAPAEINAAGLSALVAGPLCRTRYECAHDSCGPIRDPHPEPADPIAEAALWLGEMCEWMRHRPEVDEFLRDVDAAVRVLRGVVAGPGERKYLGPCGVPARWVPDPGDDEFGTEIECEGDVYGRPGAATGRCRACGAEHDQAERRQWLDDQTADLAAPARDIAHALSLPVKTIRTWATTIRTETGVVLRAAKLRTFWRDGDHLEPWADRPDGVTDQAWKAETARRGPRLHFVGDVRELAERAARRRAARQAAEMGA